MRLNRKTLALRSNWVSLTLLATTLSLLTACNSGNQDSDSSGDSTSSLTLKKYESMIADDPLVVVDFHATWCGPCQKMAPHLEKVKHDHPGKIKVIKIDTDENPELAAVLNVTVLPTIKTYSNGKLVHDTIGYQSEASLLNIVGPYVR